MNDIMSCYILLIGDSIEPDPGILEALNSQKKPVICAPSGSEPIALLLEFDIFLIIIDIQGESSHGIETALLIRSSDRFKQIPILFILEQNPGPDWKWSHQPSGIVDYMIRPLNQYILFQKILLFEDLRERKKTDEDLKQSKEELEKANTELYRLTENLEEAIEKANKMAVEAEIATISKSGFLASMSHEIRTPLNAVVGFTDLVLDTDLSLEQKEYIEAIRTASNTFLELINDILDFSKIEASMVSLENITFSPETIIDDVINTLSVRAYEKNLECAYKISPNVPNHIVGDPIRLKQILVNLMGNAIKFTSHGQIILRVNRETAPDSECCLHFSISDSGIGIPESKWNKLFQPFSQASYSTTREFGGTGLGLAISKRLVELMRGRIWIQSPNPESGDHPGAIFHVRAVFGMIKPLLSEKIPETYEILKGKHILVFEKNTTILNILCDTLGDYHMRPVPIEDSGFILQKIIRDHQAGVSFSHILLDADIPVTDLKDLVKSIRELKEFNGKIILMVKPCKGMINSHDFSNDPVIDSWLRKPMKRSTLLSKLSQLPEGPEPEKCDVISHGEDLPKHLFRILLVEDNKINQKVTSKMLSRIGHTVLIADNGLAAVEIMEKEEHFDLILMDGQMPVMDGFKATEIIRRREKSNQGDKRIPIIALTANAMKGDRLRYINAGMDDYIAKPVKSIDLSTVINRVMSKKNDGNLSEHQHESDSDISDF